MNISGVSIASVGVADYTAAGSVERLKTPQEIDDVFTAVEAGATRLSLSLAVEGLKISLAN